MRTEEYACDICGTLKTAAGPAWTCATKNDAASTPTNSYWVWSGGSTGPGVVHLCSAACAAKHLTKWIEEKTW
jgi:hypothetical protein